MGLRVLLVEGDRETTRSIDVVLRPWNDVLEVFENAADAMTVRDEFDVAIIDVTAQSAGGFALAHFLRARNATLPIIVVVAPGDAERDSVARALGATAVLPRPLTGDALLVALTPIRERRATIENSTLGVPRAKLARVLTASDLHQLAGAMAEAVFAATECSSRVVLDTESGEVVGSAGEGDPRVALILRAENETVGMLYIEDRPEMLDVDATRDDLAAICQVGAAIAILLRKVDAVARMGMKDPETSAYTFAYFVDVAGREIERARRYKRRFALLTFMIEDHAVLASATPAELLREARRELVDNILEAVRDSDVLAHVEDDELYMLVPETGMLGALAYRRRLAERLDKLAELARLESRPSLHVTIGVAAYPRDGRDLTSLLKSAHRRASATRSSAVRGTLGDVKGGLDAALGALLRHRPEEQAWKLRQAAMPSDSLAAVAAAVAREVVAVGASTDAMLFVVGEADHPIVAGTVGVIRNATVSISAWWLRTSRTGSSPSGRPPGANVQPTEIEVDAQKSGPFALVAALTEGWAYACVASAHGDYKRMMHTCDLELVEALVAQVQSTFHLQRSFE